MDPDIDNINPSIGVTLRSIQAGWVEILAPASPQNNHVHVDGAHFTCCIALFAPQAPTS